MNLTGKHILLIGGQAGLDNAIEKKLCELGAKVTNCAEGEASFDYYNVAELEANLRKLVQSQGPFDGFVFSIVHSDFKPLGFVKPDNFSKILNDNVCVFVEAMRGLVKSKGLASKASVVAISSISSIRAMKAKMAFCAAKAALDATVRCLAVELADKGIRINSILKGAVETDFEKENIQAVSSINDGLTLQKQPLGLCKAEEIGNLVTFLLSDSVMTMTGTSIVIDGGYTL